MQLPPLHRASMKGCLLGGVINHEVHEGHEGHKVVQGRLMQIICN